MISMIAAIGSNRGLGYKNDLPWKRMKNDMEFFQSFIEGKVVIMGKTTYDSLPIELKWFSAIVVSDTPYTPKYERTIVASSIEQAEEIAKNEIEKCENKEIVVGGGASIFTQFLPKADKQYLTFIKGNFKADAFFPEWKKDEWEEIERKDYSADNNNPHDYSFVTLKRIE